MAHPLSRSHKADEYGQVVATFGPRYRAIVEPNGIAWGIQRRRSNTGRWYGITFTLIHRRYLAKAAFNHMQGRYAEEHGITAETVAEALAHLPEVFEKVPLDKLLVNAPATRRPEPTSYKTAHDIWHP